MALRYFFEEYPDLHVIAAGSLLEFAMRDISFPVGRVQFLTLHPMCFAEFLLATGKHLAAQIILSPPTPQPESVHQNLLDELRRYFFIGGMPECVLAYSKNEKIRDAFEVQAEIVHSYRQDFSKYSPYTDRQCLNTVLSSTAQHIGRQIKYTHLAEGYSVPTIKKAWESLCLAKILFKVPSANPAGLPLGASASLKKFKTILIDIGLLQSLCGMPVDMEFSRPDLLDIYQGALAEQFVGQELLAAGQEELYYWARDARGSTAEVDFLAVIQGKIYPIEVKSGLSGRLKSLHLFLHSFPNCPGGWVFSCNQYSKLPEQKITFLPIYFAYSVSHR
jgi:predicted AAA+ superfamily ATPase